MNWPVQDAKARFSELVRPLIRDGEFGYERVNVEQQRRDPHSLLNQIERMIRLRKEPRPVVMT